MRREEMLASYLDVLDEINAATRVALETLSANAETTRMIIDELVNGSVDDPYTHSAKMVDMHEDMEQFFGAQGGIQNIEPTVTDDDTPESIADKVIEQINAGDKGDAQGIRALSIAIDPERFNAFEIMEIVTRKLSGEYKPEKKEEPKEEIHDEIKFNFSEDFLK